MTFEFQKLEQIADIPQHWADRVRNQVFRLSMKSKKEAEGQLMNKPTVFGMGSTHKMGLTNGLTPFRLHWKDNKSPKKDLPHRED